MTNHSNNKLPLPSALILDLDGTLLLPNTTVDPDVTLLARELSRKIPISIASGRYKDWVTKIALYLDFSAPQISDNGARLFNPVTGGRITEFLLEPPGVYAELMQLPGVRSRFTFAADQDGNEPTGDFTKANVTILSVRMDPEKGEGEKEGFELAQEIRDKFKLGVEVSRGSSKAYYVLVTNPRVNKGVAVAKLGEHLGVDPATMVAVGDGRNDIPLFREVGTSVAVDGSHPDVVKEATITLTAQEGEGNGLKKLLSNWVRG